MNKICLINLPTTAQASKDVYFPMSLVCLGSVLKKDGIPFEIVDFDLELKDSESILDWESFEKYSLNRLEETKSEIFGISAICSNYPISLLLANKIKQRWPNAKVILGGPQPSSVPLETLRTCPGIDVVAIGEGEETIRDLAKTDWTLEALGKIPGIAFLDGSLPKMTAKRTLMANLDDLPIPDFSLVPLERYLAISPGTALIEAGRGCPFLCSFCSTSLMWERNFRVKTPARIHKEMQCLSEKYGLKSFSLTHDNFTTSHRYVDEFSRYFAEHNKEGFAWSSSARPDTLNFDRIESLFKAGCRGLFLGVDSGSERIQKTMQKHLSIKHYRESLGHITYLGIEATSSFILGFAEETEDDLNQTILLALDSAIMGAMSVQLHRLAPLAGTSLLKQTKSNLSHRSGPTDVSLSPFRNEDIDNFVEKHPDLFSSFYSIDMPHMRSLNVSALAAFYVSLINHQAPILERILRALDTTPVILFKMWMEWREEAYPEKAIEQSLILNTFGQFIGESLLNKSTTATVNSHGLAQANLD